MTKASGDRNHWIGRWKVGLHPLPKESISSWEIGGLAVLPVGTAGCGLSSSLLSSTPLFPSLDFHSMWSPLKLWLVPSQSNKEGSTCRSPCSGTNGLFVLWAQVLHGILSANPSPHTLLSLCPCRREPRKEWLLRKNAFSSPLNFPVSLFFILSPL